MDVSRRKFLSYAAYLPAGLFASASSSGAPPAVSANCERCSQAGAAVLLDFSCTLEESLKGYRAALETVGASFRLIRNQTFATARLILLPASALTDTIQLQWLRRRIEEGATALVESGGAFVSLLEFRRQQLLLRSQFGLAALEPVRLWDKIGRSHGPAYVDFTWPACARIRDFSRVVPLKLVDARTEVIAMQEMQPVAVRRQLGTGTLIFLGSPAGPHLLAGDREAQTWFESLLRLG